MLTVYIVYVISFIIGSVSALCGIGYQFYLL